MSTHFNTGSSLTEVGASLAQMNDGRRVIVVRGYADSYPLLSLHLTPDMAESLIGSLNAALDQMYAQMEATA